METCRVFTYSPNNIYASEYYYACNKFDDIKRKILDYERDPKNKSGEDYVKWQKEFAYWDSKVPELSNIAGQYEEKLAAKKEKKEQKEHKNDIFTTSPFHVDGRLDYFA